MNKSINWSYFPKTDPIPNELEKVISVFEKNFKEIDTTKDEEKISKGIKDKDQRLQSDDILKILDFIIAPYMYSFKIRYTNNFHAK